MKEKMLRMNRETDEVNELNCLGVKKCNVQTTKEFP